MNVALHNSAWCTEREEKNIASQPAGVIYIMAIALASKRAKSNVFVWRLVWKAKSATCLMLFAGSKYEIMKFSDRLEIDL